MTTDMEALVGNRTRRFQELVLALALLGLGFQLTLTPGEVFKAGGALAALMLIPPIIWTLGMTVFGTARLIIVIINGVWPLSPLVRWWMSLGSFVTFCALASGYWSMLPATKGFPALILTVVVVLMEANSLFALSALRAGRSRGS